MRLARLKQMDQAGDVHERGNEQTVEPAALRSDRRTDEYLHYSVFVRVLREPASTVFATGDRWRGAVGELGSNLGPHHPTDQQRQSSIVATTDWQKIDAVAFSIVAPPGWEFHQLQGVDSYVGEFVGDGFALKFDFGEYSNPLKEEKKPAYVIVHKSIAGLPSKVVSAKAPGHGITAIYFPRTFGGNKFCLFGQDLSSTQEELALKIFETIRFGQVVPPVIPVPPPASKNVE